MNANFGNIIFMALRYVLCHCVDRKKKRDIFLVSTLFVVKIFLFKKKKNQLHAK